MSDASSEGDPQLFDKIVNLCKRRGFVFQSAEIYGGFRSTYDYGPLGSLMLRNVKDAWWRSMVQMRIDVVGLDASILSPPAVWEASGHLKNFSDPLVDCKNCGARHREDQLADRSVCPSCGARDSFTEARQFNLMFKTYAGPVVESAAEVYLRPETAQGMFINFANVLNTSRKKPPFGIAQVGKSFRNEITPGNFVFRTREFEQMELEFFVPPDQGQQWYEYWCAERLQWYTAHGIAEHMLRLRAHDADELSHYSSGTSDVEFLFPWGWGELEGIANRTDYDLKQHATALGCRAHVLRSRDQLPVCSARDRARRRRDPHDDGIPVGGLRRRRGSRRKAHRTAAALAHRTVQAGGAAAVEERPPDADSARGAEPRAAPLDVRLRRDAGHRPALPATRRDRHALLHHRRLRHARRPCRDSARARQHDPGPCPDRRPHGVPLSKTDLIWPVERRDPEGEPELPEPLA